MILNFFIEGVPLNANKSGQWAKYTVAKDRKLFRQRTYDTVKPILEGLPWYPPNMTVVSARHISPVRRRRDPSGLAERLKPILDGLVDAGALEDDDETHIRLHLLPSRKGPVAGIDITLFEAPKP
jgi:hypothetical protein